jgi:hypothetical protein
MKQYKLKRDLPTFKAGDVFYLSDTGNLFDRNFLHAKSSHIVYSFKEIEKFPNILTDWFEEIKEPTRWRPDEDQKYYLLDSNGLVHESIWADDYADRSRFEIGNCFQTEEEIERGIEYLKALAVVRGDATSKFTKGCRNWRVYYDSVYKYLAIESNFSDINNGVFGLPYFATEDDAQRSIEKHRNEWLTIFGVKEEG